MRLNTTWDFILKLTIELVPATCWYSNVRSNVRPGTWTMLQRRVAEDAKQLCQICTGQGIVRPVEAHEVWDYHDGLKVQRLAGLIALCPDCHAVKHIGRAIALGTHARALDWFMRVNGIDAGRALAEVQKALNQQRERSRYAWRLDVNVLASRYAIALDSEGREHITT